MFLMPSSVVQHEYSRKFLRNENSIRMGYFWNCTTFTKCRHIHCQAFYAFCNHYRTTGSTDTLLKRFWNADEIDVPKCVAPDDESCENLFVSITLRGNMVDGIEYLCTFPKNVSALDANSKVDIIGFLALKRHLSADEEVCQS